MARNKLFRSLLLAVAGMVLSVAVSPAAAQEPKEGIVPSQMFSPLDNKSYSKLMEWLRWGWLDPNQVIDPEGNTVVH